MRTGQNRGLAEDLSQEVFEKAWRKKDTYDPHKASIKNWIFTIARNTVTDHYRKKKIDTVPIDESSKIGNPDSTASNEIDIKELLSCLNKMNDYDRELLTFRYIEEMDISDIAQIINKSYNTTKVALHRALNRIRTIYNERHN